MRNALEIRISNNLEHIQAQDWDQMVGDGSPFLEYAWLRGLETTGCLLPEYGWLPQILSVWRDDTLQGAIPLYIKGNSYGEYVYDWSWANVAAQLGVPYYPKLIAAVPFTPVSGSRLLTRPGLHEEERKEVLTTLIRGALTWASQSEATGLHFLFVPEWQADLLEKEGFQIRYAHQYHWQNKGYRDFDHFLASFRSKKRVQIRRERRGVRDQDITFDLYRGDDLTGEIIDLAYQFYRDTCRKFGHWNRQYLNRAFFTHVHQHMPHRLQVMIARTPDGEPVAGTLTLRKGDRWYGRYWGCREDLRYLHFETCYYKPLELAIQEGIQAYEPGAGGGHKYHRGFEPTLTRSAHWLADPTLSSVIGRFLEQESEAVKEEVEHLQGHSPLIRKPGEDA